jgi:hypothetical protein
MQRMGFTPDPQLARCMHAGYPRKQVEAFLAGVASGKISLAPPKTAHENLVSVTQQLLRAAKKPVGTDQLLVALRKDAKIGPSDQANSFHSVMWKERADFVFITGAGWWLRSRPYLGHTFAVDAEASAHILIGDAVVDLLRGSQQPQTKNDIVAALKKRGLEIPAADKEVYLRTLTAQRRDFIAKLTGLGYWDRSRPYPPALYDPATWSGPVQTAAQRAGLWTIKLLNELRRPVTRAELEPLLRERGAIPAKASRAYVGNAVAEFADDIVYLHGFGYWLKRKPWPAAAYQPRLRKQAA